MGSFLCCDASGPFSLNVLVNPLIMMRTEEEFTFMMSLMQEIPSTGTHHPKESWVAVSSAAPLK